MLLELRRKKCVWIHINDTALIFSLVIASNE